MPFIHIDGATLFCIINDADYHVMLRIKWPCFLPKIVKIRAALLELLAEMRERFHLAHPVDNRLRVY